MADDNKNGHDAGTSSVKIVDRRRFDMEGRERQANGEPTNFEPSAEIEVAPEKTEDEASHVSGSQKGERKMEEKTDGQPVGAPYDSADSDITFSSFVISLATQALMQLGQMKPPPGVEIPIDKVAAKQTIDIISMLQAKTRGNLDQEESNLLEEILHNLRLGFVKAK